MEFEVASEGGYVSAVADKNCKSFEDRSPKFTTTLDVIYGGSVSQKNVTPLLTRDCPQYYTTLMREEIAEDRESER